MDARQPARTPVVTPPAPPSTPSTPSTTTSVVTPPPPPPSTRFPWPDLRHLNENTGKIISSDAQPLWEGVELKRSSSGPAYSVYGDDGNIRNSSPRIIGIMDIGADNDGGWTLFFRNHKFSTTREFKFEFYGHEPAAETVFTKVRNVSFVGGFEASSLSPVTGPPYDDSFFDHHSVKVWSFEDFSQGLSAKREVGGKVKLDLGVYGFFVHGQRTEVADMPLTGTLTYRGAAGAYVDPGRDEDVYLNYYYSHSNVARYEGELTLTVDLDNAAAVSGTIDGLKYRPFGEYVFQALPAGAQFVIENGMVPSGSNTFTADIRTQDVHNLDLQDGSVRGRFYGEGAAEEVGGTFRGYDATMGNNNRRVIGWFRGADEQPGTPGP